jgi:hypothetical protein
MKPAAVAIAENHLRELAEQLRDVAGQGREGFEAVVVAHGVRFLLVAQPVAKQVFAPVADPGPSLFPLALAEPDEEVDELPAGLRRATPKEREVYLIVRELRAGEKPGARTVVKPRHIKKRYEEVHDAVIGQTTVYHACARLVGELKVLRKDRRLGFFLTDDSGDKMSDGPEIDKDESGPSIAQAPAVDSA